jgi:hypothetical protein
MEGHSGWPYVEAELSIKGRDQIVDKFMLDTGSNRIFHINRRFAEAHGILAMLPRSNTSEGVGEGSGGSLRFTEARIDHIRIGKYTISRLGVSISPDTEGFGAEILRRFTMILDYSTSRLLLQPNTRFDDPYEIDMSGLELVTKPNDLKTILIKACWQTLHNSMSYSPLC